MVQYSIYNNKMICMNIHNYSKMLGIRLKGNEVPYDIIKLAKANNYLIFFGHSDNTIEICSCRYYEFDAYKSTTLYITHNCVYHENEVHPTAAYPVHARFTEQSRKSTVMWSFTTDIPHETFNIMENGELYCRGIVIDLNNL